MPKKVAVVMAAGKGTRMKSDLPKVLIPVCGRAMIHYVLDALEAAGIDETIVVIGYGADLVRRELAGRPNVAFALQEEQLGTGHAVMSCRGQLAGHDGAVLIVAGDSPMMQPDSLEALFAAFETEQPACLLGTGKKDDPTGLGRVVRDEQGEFARIVEEKDATPTERQIREVNLSCYVFRGPDLLEALTELRADNAQREYYLTDCPGLLLRRGKRVQALCVLKPCEALSINNMAELAAVEAALRELDLC